MEDQIEVYIAAAIAACGAAAHFLKSVRAAWKKLFKALKK